MKKEFKVWGVTTQIRTLGQRRVIVAATSRNEAAMLMGVTPGFLKDYGSPSGNPTELAVAMGSPRTVFHADKINAEVYAPLPKKVWEHQVSEEK